MNTKKVIIRSRSEQAHRKPLRKKIFFASAVSLALVAGVVTAQQGTPTTYADVPVPILTEWNDVNILTVDAVAGATAKTYIYTDAAAKQAADIEGADWDAGNTGQVYWELDDDSGKAPGIQAVTDDFDFPTNNCIMASGSRPSADDPSILIAKACSDDEGSSKRYFLEIMHADTPVDMVFDIGSKDIRYKGVKNPEVDGGAALSAFREEFGIGRIYRVMQKAINNSDERWVAINVELGHGIGDAFEPFNFEEDGVAFEMRNQVPRSFFDGETGAPPIRVWNPQRFSTFSSKAFDDGSRDRFEEGFFSNEAAGLFPPTDIVNATDDGEKASFIGSGEEIRLDGAYGAITPNYFSLADSDGVAPGVFGYMLSDSLAPTTISRFDAGIAGGESDAIVAWWDGSDWLYGQKGDASGDNPYGVVPDSQLTEWADQLLGVDDPSKGDSSVRYASELADDIAGQNMDFFIYINDDILDETGTPKYDNITVRVTGVSTNGVASTLGNDTPAWISNPAPELSSYRTPAPAKKIGGGGGGGGCSYNAKAPFDPTLPLLLLIAVGALVTRNRRRQQQA